MEGKENKDCVKQEQEEMNEELSDRLPGRSVRLKGVRVQRGRKRLEN